MAQDYRQSVLANNLANVDTPGFKPDRVAFVERLNASMARGTARHGLLEPMTGGVFEAPVYTDFTQGGLVATGAPLDVALEGDGFLAVQTADGVRYTRDGRMLMDKDGGLVHAGSGGRVLDSSGRPLVLSPGRAGRVSIDETGLIRQAGETIGRLGIVGFEDRSGLEKEGRNLFAAGTARPGPSGGVVRQGYTEASGAEPVEGLVEMIAASRAYQMNATLISLQDESLGRVVNELGRIG
jgi:flagellar basal body rod protein FlgG